MRHDDGMTARRSVTVWVGSLVLLAVGLAAACGDDGPTTEEATAEFCEAQADIDETITDVRHLDPSDLDELDDAREELGDDIDELGSAGQELAEAEWDEVEDAADELQDTIDDIDADSSFREAAERLGEARGTLAEAWDDIVSNVDCG
jgi:DNA repair ATPase RecN